MTQPRLPFEAPASATALTPVPPGGPGSPAVVAFYLPQYHRIPENDAWWGEGFTDWRNVMAVKPLYPGHAIPNLPGELGAYDLLSWNVRSAQAELAREHGVYAFCYYFYWFGGRQLLERPLELMLADGEPSHPFCLCWANEPWTRRWDGRESDVLQPQHHERVRDLAILGDLMLYFEDERYIRIDGRPLLLVYRQSLLDKPARFAAELREEAVRRGLPGLFLCNVMSIGDADGVAKGFDAAVEFPPNGTLGKEIKPRVLGADPAFKGKIYDYASVVQTMLARPIRPFPYFPGIMPRWDNTARKGLRAHVFHGSTPELFERWLRHAALASRRRHPRSPLVFVNSWNEWAEAAQLEPDQRTSRRYLEVIRGVVRRVDNYDHGSGPRRGEAGDGLPMIGQAAEETVLVPGWPDEALRDTTSDGVASIELVDGQLLQTHVVRAARAQALRLSGWLYGDSRSSGRGRSGRYLVLSAGDSRWHAPITRWQRRPDLLRGMLGRGRRSRRLVRAIDRLPPKVGRLLLRLWAVGRDHFGFDASIDLRDLPRGNWDIDFVEVTTSGAWLVNTGFVLHHERHS